MRGGISIKKINLTFLLMAVLLILSVISLFVGVLDMNVSGLASGDLEQLEILLISRLPRLLAILCTGIGMSVAGLIMQQLCMNKFVSPTTGATIS
ncbi:MAG TPA: iron chelate uptake ABC transporter family permease subunit, partial [Candidatus Choladousia intestinigallinarum]|nr:iron chelate uptake ABC transporter family permease subunit [Candidatus Choladousia intestinigallinarum]